MVDTNGKVFGKFFDITAFRYRRVCTANPGGSSATSSPCSDLIGSGQGVMTGGGCDCGGWDLLVSMPNTNGTWFCQCSGNGMSACIVCLESE